MSPQTILPELRRVEGRWYLELQLETEAEGTRRDPEGGVYKNDQNTNNPYL